jgi:hypothetical protein
LPFLLGQAFSFPASIAFALTVVREGRPVVVEFQNRSHPRLQQQQQMLRHLRTTMPQQLQMQPPINRNQVV